MLFHEKEENENFEIWTYFLVSEYLKSFFLQRLNTAEATTTKK